MLWQLRISQPTLPPRAADPNRPSNIRPVDPANPEGNWTDALGHFVTRSPFGQWTTYDDGAGVAGGSASEFGDVSPFSEPRYTDIELLTTRDGRRVRTAEDWWLRRRPELFRLLQEHVYGHIPPRSRWPRISWAFGPATTGTAVGFDYQEVVLTGTCDISAYPQIRIVPVIRATLRTPLDKRGQPVPVMVVFDSAANVWQYAAPYGYGVCGYAPTALQPDSGGANMSTSSALSTRAHGASRLTDVRRLPGAGGSAG